MSGNKKQNRHDLLPSQAQSGESRARRVFRRILRAVVVLLIVAYFCSGIYMIKPDEVGVVRQFGKVICMSVEGKSVPTIFPPGLHYRWPYPITRLDKVRPTETKTVSVGFEAMDQLLGREADPRTSEFLTGDQNVMRLRMTVQYTIGDPIAFLYGTANPEGILLKEAESCLTRAVAEAGVDNLIGAERVKISASVRADLDREIKLHDPGAKVTAVSLQAPTPPREVANAFNDVQSAKAEKHRMGLEAEGYRNEVVTRAYGEADKLMREGEAYRQKRVAEAEGEAKRFEDLYEEYKQAKEITALRLYIEAMEEILPKMKKVIVGSDKEGGPIDLGIIEMKQ